MMLIILSPIVLLASSVLAKSHGLLRRQDGPVDPGIPEDCTYYDTALSKLYNCDYFANEWGVTREEFLSYNPSINEDCSNIKVGNSYCVEVNNGQPRPTSTTASGSGTTPTTSPVPSPTQEGLIKSCTKFHFAQKGETCDKIVGYQGGAISLADFIAWNPAVEDDCSGIWANTYYCIAIPGTPTAAPTTVVSTSPPTATAPSPTQEGLIKTCNNFYKTAAKADTCAKIVEAYGTFTLSEFVEWNPAVASDCSGLWAVTYYCVGVPGTPTFRPSSSAPVTTAPSGPSPTQDGIISTCKTYYKAVSGDTCQNIVAKYGVFSLTEFQGWNPALGADCSGLWLGYYYCIAIPATPTAKPTTIITTTKPATPTGPSPTQTGIVSTCKRYHKAVSGDTCQTIIDTYGTFTLALFKQWNPAVGSDCSSFWLGYYYCVGIPGTPTVKPTSTTPTPTPTGCTSAPTPTQPGAVCACKKWHKVVTGNTCATIQKQYSITAANFNKWNPKVGTACTTLWLGYNVCVSA